VSMRVLIACEFSGVVREAFRKRGHDAWSCDLLPSMDESIHHFTRDVKEVVSMNWDLIIAHPPCTWLCAAMRTNAARKDRPNITPIFEKERDKSFAFAMTFFDHAEKVCVENPIGYINSKFRKPDQIIRPWMHGHPYNKDVCLWLKGLPKLFPTNIIEPPYKKLDFWSTQRNPKGYSRKSITFSGIAEAMADQWGTTCQSER
jgi:hypothetical protein